MNTEDKLILAGAGLLAAYYLFQQLKNPDHLSKEQTDSYIMKAADKRGLSIWYPQPDKIAVMEPMGDQNVTYFFSQEDINQLNRAQRLALTNSNIPLSTIFDTPQPEVQHPWTMGFESAFKRINPFGGIL